jgi:hypothetical protein
MYKISLIFTAFVNHVPQLYYKRLVRSKPLPHLDEEYNHLFVQFYLARLIIIANISKSLFDTWALMLLPFSDF